MDQVAQPVNLLNSGIAFTAKMAKLAQERDWVEEERKTRLVLHSKGLTPSDIDTCLKFAPFNPESRIHLLASHYGDKNWQQWAESWATAQEIEHVIANAPTSLPSPLVPAPPQAVEAAEPAVEVNLSPCSSLESKGRAIEAGFRAYGLGLIFEPGLSSDSGLRCDRLVFRKPLDVPFSAPQKYVAEALSNAGIDPEAGVIFRCLPDNCFEMQIPRPVSEWRIAHLFQFLSDPAAAQILQQRNVSIEDRILSYSSHLRSQYNTLPHNPPSSPLLVDLDGQIEWINLSSHTLIGGGSEGGKSSLIKTLICSLMLLYPPEWVQFALMDFKDEAPTLNKFEGTDWVWGNLEACKDPKDASIYWNLLRDEANARSKRIVGAECENIAEYNESHPDTPIPWLFVVIDEVGGYKKACKEEADDWLEECMSRWRSWGIVCIASTQYPSAQYAIGPSVRVNFKTRILTACDEQCAKLVFGESDRMAIAATRLVPPGDCMVKHQGKYVRGQALFIAPGLLKQFLGVYVRKTLPFDPSILAA